MTVLLPSLSSDNKVLASEEGLIEKFCSGIIMILSVLTGDLTVQERLVRSLWWPTRSQSGVLRVKATFWTSTGEWPGSVSFPPRFKILNWQTRSLWHPMTLWHYDTMTLWYYDTMTRSLWHPMTIHVMHVTPIDKRQWIAFVTVSSISSSLISLCRPISSEILKYVNLFVCLSVLPVQSRPIF